MPSDTAASLLNAARAGGAQLKQDSAVTGITVRAGRVRGVLTPHGEYAAPIVVNAAGLGRGIESDGGLDLPYDTWRHDTMFVRRPQGFGPAHLTVIDAANECISALRATYAGWSGGRQSAGRIARHGH